MMSLNSPYSTVDPVASSACLLQTPSIISALAYSHKLLKLSHLLFTWYIYNEYLKLHDYHSCYVNRPMPSSLIYTWKLLQMWVNIKWTEVTNIFKLCLFDICHYLSMGIYSWHFGTVWVSKTSELKHLLTVFWSMVFWFRCPHMLRVWRFPSWKPRDFASRPLRWDSCGFTNRTSSYLSCWSYLL